MKNTKKYEPKVKMTMFRIGTYQSNKKYDEKQRQEIYNMRSWVHIF